LAADKPITFAAFLRQLAKRQHGRKLAIVPVPRQLALWLADLSSWLPGRRHRVGNIDRARAVGRVKDAGGVAVARPDSQIVAQLPHGELAGYGRPTEPPREQDSEGIGRIVEQAAAFAQPCKQRENQARRGDGPGGKDDPCCRMHNALAGGGIASVETVTIRRSFASPRRSQGL
jgi:hypothetical protein